MVSNIDFYNLPIEKQRRLVNCDRVATTDQLIDEVPDERIPLRVFEDSLGELILDLLETGQYSLSDIKHEFNVKTQDVRNIIQSYRKRSNSNFKGRYSKFSLLEERNGVIRIKKDVGKTSYYSLEKIPYFARIVDPTLCVSLLNIDKRIEQFPELTEEIPSKKAALIDEEYAIVMGDFWDINPQEVFDYITKYDRKYVETNLMPFPVVNTKEEYNNVESRFRQPDSTYNRFRIDESSIEDLGHHFLEKANKQQAGILAYQEISIEFADLKWYAQIKEPSLLRTIDDWFEKILKTLNPDISPVLASDIDSVDAETENMRDNISLEDRVLSTLSAEPQSKKEIYESFPIVAKESVNKTDVYSAIERLENLGIVDVVVDSGAKKYSNKSGNINASPDNEGDSL